MSFDLSRVRFNAHRDFLGVIMQQGRVQLDSDWNDLVDQLARRIQAGSLDTFGPAVVPRTTPDGFRIEAAGGELKIHPGRIYVDGLLAENHGRSPDEWDRRLAGLAGTGPMDYEAQPYFPNPPELPDSGPHLVYLDVWQRDVTHLEDPDLVEKAVGVDSTGRRQTVWQVKVLEDVGNITCATADEDIPGWEEATRPAASRLSTGTGDPPGEAEPCQVPPSAGYRGLENQLYRVEIHRGGAVGVATFKWSRDNATVATRVTHINPARTRLTVESIGRDNVLGFHDGDWVEVTDDWREFNNLPGEIRRIRLGGGVDAASKSIELETALPAGAFPADGQDATDSARHTRLRRWDQAGLVLKEDGSPHVDLDAAGTGEIPVPAAGARIFLENGILVEFHLAPAGGTFESGEYWIFAARSVDASIEILDEAPPLGIHHHYARLAVVTFPDAETDCRTLWPPQSEGHGCDCSVCVTAVGHNEGTATIQNAVDAVKDSGGTICLGSGIYQIREPLRIDGAKSLRIRGQGWSTVLKGETPGAILQLTGGLGLVIENLSVIGSTTARGGGGIVMTSNVVGVRLDRLIILGLSGDDTTSTALEMSGYAIGCVINDCVLIADRGISNAGGDSSFLLTADFHAESNLLVCGGRGLSFDGISFHFGASSIVENTIMGCTEASIVALGAAPAGSHFTVSRNVIYVRGTGVRAGVDGLRIQDNEISAFDEESGDGIVLEQGLDPAGIGQVHIIGNRIRGINGHGLAIRYHVGTGMIKQNMVTDTGLAGLILEEAGNAAFLSIDNNYFSDLGLNLKESKDGYAALQLIRVSRLDVLNNRITRCAMNSQVSSLIVGLMGAGVGEVRAAGNRIDGIGPNNLRSAAAIYFPAPLRTAKISGNSISRAADETGEMSVASWQAILAGAADIQEGVKVVLVGRMAFLFKSGRGVLLTTSRIHDFEETSSSVTVSDNHLRGELTQIPLVDIEGVETCLFLGNHCQVTGEPGHNVQIGILSASAVNAGNNRLIGTGGTDGLVLEVRAGSTRAPGGIVLGNISTGRIFLNGSEVPSSVMNIIGV